MPTAEHANTIIATVPHVGLTMSSREIAEITGKRHDNVRADIEKMGKELSLTFQEKVEPSEGGRPTKLYLLEKRETLILTSGYSTAMRARIIDRWLELEAATAPGAIRAPTTLREALLLALDQQEQIEAQKTIITGLAPKADAYDRLAVADWELGLRAAAKLLHVAERSFIQWMHAHHWIYRSGGTGPWMAYAERTKSGDLTHRIHTQTTPEGEKVRHQVVVTLGGLAKLARLIPGAFVQKEVVPADPFSETCERAKARTFTGEDMKSILAEAAVRHEMAQTHGISLRARINALHDHVVAVRNGAPP